MERTLENQVTNWPIYKVLLQKYEAEKTLLIKPYSIYCALMEKAIKC